jgi:hypothetical protein
LEYDKYPKESAILFGFIQHVLEKVGEAKFKEEREKDGAASLLDSEWAEFDMEVRSGDGKDFEKTIQGFFGARPWLSDAANHVWKVRLPEMVNMQVAQA